MNDKFEEYLEDCDEVGVKIKSIREDERKRFLNKAKEWIRNNMRIKTTSYADIWDDSEIDQVVSDFYTIEEMIDSFCKAIKE